MPRRCCGSWRSPWPENDEAAPAGVVVRLVALSVSGVSTGEPCSGRWWDDAGGVVRENAALPLLFVVGVAGAPLAPLVRACGDRRIRTEWVEDDDPVETATAAAVWRDGTIYANMRDEGNGRCVSVCVVARQYTRINCKESGPGTEFGTTAAVTDDEVRLLYVSMLFCGCVCICV